MNIDFLKKTMSEKRISVGELAKEADVGQATISEILTGVRRDVKLKTAKKIAKVLDIKIEDLCEEE